MQPIIKNGTRRPVGDFCPSPLASPVEAEEVVAQVAQERPEPHARLLRIGDEVRGIELTCSCGETSVIEIEYEETPDNDPETRS